MNGVDLGCSLFLQCLGRVQQADPKEICGCDRIASGQNYTEQNLSFFLPMFSFNHYEGKTFFYRYLEQFQKLTLCLGVQERKKKTEEKVISNKKKRKREKMMISFMLFESLGKKRKLVSFLLFGSSKEKKRKKIKSYHSIHQ